MISSCYRATLLDGRVLYFMTREQALAYCEERKLSAVLREGSIAPDVFGRLVFAGGEGFATEIR